MAISLGIDTGGTYTDAVLIRDEETVLASAKALTTRHDLAVGIGQAVDSVLKAGKIDPSDIRLASLSTTLATNALIEGQGDRIGLVLAGFEEKDAQRHGLLEAVGDDPFVLISGGHDHAGAQAAPLDLNVFSHWLETVSEQVGCFSVAAQFATRNPEHENTLATLIQERTGKPVSCSHHLSAKLNGPKRAITAVLNARLIGMIDRLIQRATARLAELGVAAPLMVVRGDGALISADFARERPIETILSGPAASIVGAKWMTKVENALVSDIGGTTTDIAILRDGRPSIDPNGAYVGPYRTMVEAVAMRTTGLGGDSEVHFVSEGLEGGIRLGPKRAVPLSLVAHQHGKQVLTWLEKHLNEQTPSEHAGRFAVLLEGQLREGLTDAEEAIIARFSGSIEPLGTLLKSRRDHGVLRRLRERGLIQIASVTPSDASHVLGLTESWNSEAAEMGIALFCRQNTGAGVKLANDPRDMARLIVRQLQDQTVSALLETAFSEERSAFTSPPAALSHHELTKRGLQRHRGLLKIDVGLNTPVIGLGASAQSYYPKVGETLSCDMILPEYAGVANAIGAVVGRVTLRLSATITSPSSGLFKVHLDSAPKDFTCEQRAFEYLEAALREKTRAQARAAGAEEIEVHVSRDERRADVEGSPVFIEATVTVEASGRPRIAD